MAKELAGKNALVTGSCIGLGAAIARALATLGARVVVTGYPVDKGQALAQEIGGIFLPADLRNPDETSELGKKAVATLGGLDILVNNAAVSQRARLDEITPELFDTQFHIIVRAPLLLAQAALPSLIQRRGVIINIASVNGDVGGRDLLIYSAAKGALITASRNMANALKYARVRVICFKPGWIDTEGERGMMTGLGHPEDYLDRQGERFPMGRLLNSEEVADVIAFFASPRAEAFSGQVIDLEQHPIAALTAPWNTEDES